MEYVREVRISIYVDTNKQTIKEDFRSFDELKDWLDRLDEDGPIARAFARSD